MKREPSETEILETDWLERLDDDAVAMIARSGKTEPIRIAANAEHVRRSNATDAALLNHGERGLPMDTDEYAGHTLAGIAWFAFDRHASDVGVSAPDNFSNGLVQGRRQANAAILRTITGKARPSEWFAAIQSMPGGRRVR